MSDAAAVRWMEVATELVLGPLEGEAISSINAIGELLAAMTERDLEAVEKGERWGQRRSRLLSQEEARKLLRGLTLDQLDVLADRSGHSLHELFEWSCGQREIHSGALWLLGQRDEMAKITGGER